MVASFLCIRNFLMFKMSMLAITTEYPESYPHGTEMEILETISILIFYDFFYTLFPNRNTISYEKLVPNQHGKRNVSKNK